MAAERFYGEVDFLTGEDGQPVFDDIDGMSGGPILAFKRDASGLRYWVIGVQSVWHKPTRTIGACPIQDFVHGVAAGVDKLMAGGGG